ncbi:MAG: alpha/beta fold hydrolase [Pigmentiphaga sp.]
MSQDTNPARRQGGEPSGGEGGLWSAMDDDGTTPSAAPSDAPTLLLLPGLMCDAAVWRDVRAELGDDVPSVIAEYGLADDLEAMARIALAQAPHGPLVLAGHSMGGRIAFEIHRLAPERVLAMCVLNSGHWPLAEGEAGERERQGRLALLRLARERNVRAMALEWARPMVHPSRLATPLFDEVVDMVARRSAFVLAAQTRALLARPDASEMLRSLRCPTTIATGREDGWSPVERNEAMAALVPQARFEILEGCGHMSPQEQPAAVARLLRDSLAAATAATVATAARAATVTTTAAMQPPASIALIGFGEAGACLGAGLAARGLHVRTYDILWDDDATRPALEARAHAAGVRPCASLAAAIDGAELVISAVTAGAAADAAHQAAARLRPGQWFLDINSVSPDTKRLDEEAVAASGAHYVEAAVMAPVPPAGLRVPMLLGGARAAELAPRLVAAGMRAEAVATRVGVASAIKMCRSVVIKGLEAITVESLRAARRHGAEDAVLASLAETFPSLGWTDQLPDYLVSRVAEHGRRRAEEMREVATTLRDVDIMPEMSEATARVQDSLVDAMGKAGLGYDASRTFSWRELADRLDASARPLSRN